MDPSSQCIQHSEMASLSLVPKRDRKYSPNIEYHSPNIEYHQCKSLLYQIYQESVLIKCFIKFLKSGIKWQNSVEMVMLAAQLNVAQTMYYNSSNHNHAFAICIGAEMVVV